MFVPRIINVVVKSRQLLIAAVFILPGFFSTLQAQTIRYVTPTGTGDGSSWANASADLQSIINTSAVDDQVWVAIGEYKPGGADNANRTISFAMKNGVGIYGGFLGSETALSQRRNPQTQFAQSVLSGEIGDLATTSDNSYHIIKNPRGINTSALLDGFVITAGRANGSEFDSDGAGMFNEGSNSGNECSPTIANCSFDFNVADSRGGAVFNHGDSGASNPRFTNCSFIINSSASGGAIYNFGFLGVANVRLTSCLFQGNSASSTGGAICNSASSCQLANCSFVGNSAFIAGVFYDGNGSDGIRSIFTNCSFLSNKASYTASVTYSFGSGPTSATLFTNCVFFGNGGANSFYNPYNGKVIADYCLFETSMAGYGYTATNSQTVSTSPFSSTTSTRLSSCSPAVNAGLNTASGLNGITTDLDGNPRTMYGRVDMGAYEVQSVPPLSLTISATPGFTITRGTQVALAATGATRATWNTGATTATISPTPLTTTTYSVTGVTGGCMGTASSSVSVVCGTAVFVTQNGAGAGNGSSWSNAYAGTSLQQAINFAGGCGSQVWVAAGTYRPTTTTTRTISFSLVNGVSIYGGFAGSETSLTQRTVFNPITGQPSSSTLSGDIGTLNNSSDNSLHIIKNPRGTQATAILDGFVIANGNANAGADDSYGAGIYNVGIDVGGQCHPTIRNCLFMNNMAAESGAAVCNDGRGGSCNPQFSNCLFQKNTALAGGGVMINRSLQGICSPYLLNCSFGNNTATNSTAVGGALYNIAGSGLCSPQLVNCLFQNNSATANGGAIYNEAGQSGLANPQLTNCTFQSNSANSGGAIANINLGGVVNPVLTNCVVFGNGGARTFSGLSTIANGGGISLVATYSLFEPSSLSVSTVNVSGPGNLTTVSSPFVSATNATLLTCSGAVNSGLNLTSGLAGVTTDLMGNPRVVGQRVDMGAYESSVVGTTALESVRVGNWNNTATWSCGRLPTLTDSVILQHIVTIPVSFVAQAAAINYRTGGRLLLSTLGQVRIK